MKRRLSMFLLGLALTAAVPAMAASDKEQVEAAYKAWNEAFNRGDAKAVASFYAENATLLPPTHDVLKGRAAIEKFFAGLFKAGVTDHTLDLINEAADQRGVVAAAKWAAKGKGNDGAEQALGGSVVHVFEKQKDGDLKLWMQIFN